MPERNLNLESILVELPRNEFRKQLRKQLEAKIMSTMAVTGVPKGFTTITPYLAVENIEALIDFVKNGLGGVDVHRTPTANGGTHAIVTLGDSILYLGGGGPAKGREKLSFLHVYVEDADKVWHQAIAAGASPITEPADRPYGDREGMLRDPVGNLWSIATSKTTVLPSLMRTATPFLVVKDAFGLIDFCKRAFGAKEEGIHRNPDGSFLHGYVSIGTGVLEFGERENDDRGALYLYVDDVDALYRQAIDAGATVLYPLADQPYGDRMGGVQDPWGFTWYLATRLAP